MRKLFIAVFFLVSSFVLQAQMPKLILPFGHKSSLICKDFSDKEKRILTASSDFTAKIWDYYSGKLLSTLDGFIYPIVFAKFSLDGNKIVVGSYENVKVYDAKTAQMLFSIDNIANVVNIDFSPDNKSIVISHGDIAVYDINNGKKKFELKGEVRVENVFFSKNGDKLLTKRYRSNIVKIWDIQSGEVIKEVVLFATPILSMEKSLDNQIIAACQNGVKLFDIDTLEGSKFLLENIKTIKSAKFSVNQDHIILIKNDSVLNYINLNNKQVNEKTFKKSAIFNAESLNDSILKIKFYNSREVQLWNVNSDILRRVGCKDITKMGTERVFIDLYDGNSFLASYPEFNFIYDFENKNSPVSDVKISPNGEEFISGSSSGWIQIWKKNQLNSPFYYKHKEKGTEYGVKNIYLDPSGKYIASVNVSGQLRLWPMNPNEAFNSYIKGACCVKSLAFSRDGKHLLYTTSSSAYIYSMVEQKIVLSFSGGKQYIKSAIFDCSERFVLITFSNRQVVILDVKNQQPIFSPIGEFDSSIFVGTDFKGYDTRLLLKNKNSLQYWDFQKKKLIDSTKLMITGATIGWYLKNTKEGNIILHDSNNKFIVLKSSNNYERMVWENGMSSEEIIRKKRETFIERIVERKKNELLPEKFFTSKNVEIKDVNNNTVLGISSEESIVRYDLSNENEICKISIIDSVNYVITTPNGYYSCPNESAKLLHYVTKDLKVITFEQLDVKYNRPDKVLQAIGNTDTTLIQSYKRAYEKRIEKLRIDTTSFTDDYNVPEAGFVNSEPKIENGRVVLRIKGEDKKSKLAQFNVWVNEVPVYGLRGVSIRHLNSYKLDTSITIQLSEGENRIETSVRNLNGIESYRMPLIIKYNPETKPKEKVYFVGIGIDKFKDNSRNLMYSVTDIRVLAAEMQKKYGSNLVIVDTLINTKVTIENVKALKKKLLKTTVNDKVIVAYSGHGLLNAKNDYYLATYSVDFKKPEENGLNYDDLESIIDSIPARKKLLLLDACHSGEVDRGDPIIDNKTDIANNTTAANKEGTKSGPKPLENPLKNRLGLKNSFELMQSLFVNVGKNTGTTIFTAAAGKQAAYESNKLGHGVFTYFIIDAFRNKPTLTVSKLKEFVSQNVEKESKKSQIPTSRSEMIAVDWILW